MSSLGGLLPTNRISHQPKWRLGFCEAAKMSPKMNPVQLLSSSRESVAMQPSRVLSINSHEWRRCLNTEHGRLIRKPHWTRANLIRRKHWDTLGAFQLLRLCGNNFSVRLVTFPPDWTLPLQQPRWITEGAVSWMPSLALHPAGVKATQNCTSKHNNSIDLTVKCNESESSPSGHQVAYAELCGELSTSDAVTQWPTLWWVINRVFRTSSVYPLIHLFGWKQSQSPAGLSEYKIDL